MALGYAKELVTNNMIVGTQLVDFITKIKSMAEDDLYLKGSLYLYDADKYAQYGKEFLDKKYANTEELFFVLSLFDNVEKAFDNLKNQIIILLGKDRTISAINNIKLYAWIINSLYSVLKGYKKKDAMLLKKMIIIPTKQIKQDSDVYKVLYENGYTKEEIAYLNYGLLYFSEIPNTVELYNSSITEERIAVNFCITILHKNSQQPQILYDMVKWIIKKYRKFDIRLEGDEGLLENIRDKINIIDPITFFNFRRIFPNRLFSFNILEEKWDVLAQKMEKDEYKTLFNDFIEQNNFDRTILEKCIERYNKLANTSYLESFHIPNNGRTSIFNQLVDKDLISLREYYEEYEKQRSLGNNVSINHLKSYVNKIQSRNAYNFLKYILEERGYSIEETDKMGFNISTLYENYRSYYYVSKIDIKRSFLSKEESKKLFLWLDNYIFTVEPEDYIHFIKDALRSDFVSEVVPKEELRAVYLMLIKIDKEYEKNQQLREKYLTKKELQDIIDRENKEKERQKMIKLQEKKNELIADFFKVPKASLKDIYGFCDGKQYDDETWNICKKIVKGYLDKNIENFEISEGNIIGFFRILELFIRQKELTLDEVKGYINRYMDMEEYNYGIFKRAC